MRHRRTEAVAGQRRDGPEPGQGEKREADPSGERAGTPGARGDCAVGFERNPGAAMHCEHRDADESRQQREGIEQAEEAAVIDRA